MTLRARLTFLGLAAIVPLIAAVVLMKAVNQPTIAIVLVLAPFGVALARRSIAYPVALGGVPTLVLALLGRDPFPHGLITALFFGWTALAILFALLAGEQRLPLRLLIAGPIVFSILIAVDLLARLPSSLSPSYGSTKVQLFVLQNVTLLIAATLIAQRWWHLERLLTVTLLIAGASGLVLAFRLLQGNAQTVFTNRYSISSQENPIQFARQSADGLLIAVYVTLASTRRWARIPALLLLPILAVALLAAGSRGPVLGGIVGLVTLFAVLAQNRSARRRLLAAAGAGLIASIAASQLVPGGSISRSVSFLTGAGSGLSSNGRTHVWAEAWNHFLAHPLFGLGTGSFYAIDGVEHYPHNLLLEAAVELGLVGVVLVGGFLVAALVSMVRARATQGAGDLQVAVVIALFVSALVNASFSGDIQTNSSVWLYAGLGLGLSIRGSFATAADPDPALRLDAASGSPPGRQRP